jgi:hypothetical protein
MRNSGSANARSRRDCDADGEVFDLFYDFDVVANRPVRLTQTRVADN